MTESELTYFVSNTNCKMNMRVQYTRTYIYNSLHWVLRPASVRGVEVAWPFAREGLLREA